MYQIKRVYDKPAKSDGYRVLVDRFYPRGLSKAKAAYKVWFRDIAPSADLIKWYHQDPEKRWKKFKAEYKKELRSKAGKVELADLIDIIESRPVVTLLYGAKDPDHNNAVILFEVLKKIV